MAASEDSDNKILLFNNNEPPESNLCSFEKIYSQNNISYKEKTVISKVKCLKKYNEVWINIKLLFWFGKDQMWVEIK